MVTQDQSLRSVVNDSLSRGLFHSAVFYADKLANLTGSAADVSLLCRTLVASRQFRRAAAVLDRNGFAVEKVPQLDRLRSSGQHSKQFRWPDLQFTLIRAQCLEALEEWETLRDLLETVLLYQPTTAGNIRPDGVVVYMQPPDESVLELADQSSSGLPEDKLLTWAAAELAPVDLETAREARPVDSERVAAGGISTTASLLVHLATALMNLEDYDRAPHIVSLAMQCDPRCIEALDLMLDREMLSGHQQEHLLQHCNWTVAARTLAIPSSAANSALEQSLCDSNPARPATPPRRSTASTAATASAPQSPPAACTASASTTWLEDFVASSMLYAPSMAEQDEGGLDEGDRRLARLQGESAEGGHGFATNVDVLATAAARLHARGATDECIRLCNRVLRWDPEHPRALKTQVGALATGKHSQALFELGNRLANDHPDWPLSWYTVGCYYLTVGETGEAKYNFSKAGNMEPNFALAWVGVGHAALEERDIEQALSSFRAAGRLMVGSHIPLQAMAVLCRQRGQHQLALDMLIRANGMVPHDLNVQHDVAVTLFACKRFDEAHSMALDVLSAIQARGSRSNGVAWRHKADKALLASVYATIGFCASRLSEPDLEQAVTMFEKSLSLKPGVVDVLCALGLVLQAQNQHSKAVDVYYQVPVYDMDNALVKVQLPIALSKASEDLSSLLGADWKSENPQKLWQPVEASPAVRASSGQHVPMTRFGLSGAAMERGGGGPAGSVATSSQQAPPKSTPVTSSSAAAGTAGPPSGHAAPPLARNLWGAATPSPMPTPAAGTAAANVSSMNTGDVMAQMGWGGGMRRPAAETPAPTATDQTAVMNTADAMSQLGWGAGARTANMATPHGDATPAGITGTADLSGIESIPRGGARGATGTARTGRYTSRRLSGTAQRFIAGAAQATAEAPPSAQQHHRASSGSASGDISGVMDISAFGTPVQGMTPDASAVTPTGPSRGEDVLRTPRAEVSGDAGNNSAMAMSMDMEPGPVSRTDITADTSGFGEAMDMSDTSSLGNMDDV